MKRRIAIILLLITGGAIVNIAVAWGVWRLRDWRDVEGVECQLPASRLLQSAVEEVVDGADLNQKQEYRWSYRVLGAEEYVYQWVGHPVGGTSVFASWLRYGLPLRTVEGGSFFLVGGDKHMSDFNVASLELSDALRHRWFTADVAIVPIHPIWSGFIINTLFYALLLWLLIATPFTARRMIRRRRGLCEQCAYPLGTGPVCTECGAPFRRRIIT